MWINDVAQALTYFLAMLLTLTFRESSRAFMAHLRGDDSARREGRLSLNPAVHADLVGTIILPLAGFLAQMPIIGWAKPIPIEERNFRNYTLDVILVSLVGPLTNFVLAFFSVVLLRVYSIYGQEWIAEGSFWFPLIKLLIAFAMVNATIGFFNLIPIPPMDGAALLRLFLSRDTYERFAATVAPYTFIVLLVLIVGGGFTWIGAASRVYIGFCDVLASFLVPGNIMGS